MKAEDTPDNEVIIVCTPEDQPHLAASRLIEAECRHRVWLAPTSEPALAAGGRTICINCLPPNAFKAGNELSFASGAGRELAEALGVSRSDQIMTALHNAGFRAYRVDQ